MYTEPTDILLVEDNPGDVRLVKEAFKTTERDQTIHVATDGSDAVADLRRMAENGALPDIVLLDLNLPGRNGHEILETIRETPELQRLPVIILTSSRAQEDVARCYAAKANAYLTKPTDTDDFSELVQSIERFWFEQATLPPLSV